MKLSNLDVYQLALQRTSTLSDYPIVGKLSLRLLFRYNISLPLKLECLARRNQIISRAMREIEAEVDQLRPFIRQHSSICDIGCGLAIHDAILCRDYNVDNLLLIDIEESDKIYHYYSRNGAGYASLSSAKDLVNSMSPTTSIATLNPRIRDLGAIEQKFDLITSYISCGFHYPVDLYVDFFRSRLESSGRLFLDLRKQRDHRALEEHFRLVDVIADCNTHQRVVLMAK